MTYPLAITVVGVCIPLMVFLFGVIKVKNGNGKFVRDDICAIRHQGLEKDIGEIKDNVNTLTKDVKSLLRIQSGK